MLLIALVILLILLVLIEKEVGRNDEPDQVSLENCSKCGSELPDDLLLCPGCRKLLREHCTYCGQSKLVSHSHCPWCGQKSQKEVIHGA